MDGDSAIGLQRYRSAGFLRQSRRNKNRNDDQRDTIAWLVSEIRDWLDGRYVSYTWDMEELLSRRDEIVEGDKLKVKMVFRADEA